MRYRIALFSSIFVIFWTVPALAQPEPEGEPTEATEPTEPLPAGETPAAPGQPPPPPATAPPGQGYPPAGYPPPGYGQGYPPPGYGQGYPPSYGQPYPPPPPPPDLTIHRHDGFYLRFGIGPAYGDVKSKGNLVGADIEATYSGWGPAYELLIGGTLGSGFVLGGGFVGQDIQDPDITIDLADSASASGVAEDETLGVVVLGMFADWFPNPEGGAHFGGMVGIGGVGLKGDDDTSSTGLGVSLWGGYDFWVGEQWSLGPEARIVAVSAQRDVAGQNFDDTATSLELMFTALYH